MKKLIRSCTALLMALCLVLGLCSTGIQASAVESPVSKESLVDWAKEIMDRVTDVSKADVAAKLESLVAEAREILDRIEAIDISKENAVEELKKLIAKAEDVMDRIQESDVGNLECADEIKLLAGGAIVVLAKIADVDLLDEDAVDLIKKLVKEARDVLVRIEAINVREKLTAANIEELLKVVIEKTEAKIAEVEQYVNDKEAELDAAVADAEAQLADAKEKLADAKQDLADAKAKVAEKEEELKNAAVADKAQAEAELADAKAELADADAKLADAEDKLADAEAEMDAAVADAETAIAEIRTALSVAKKALKKVEPYVDVVMDDAQPVLDQMFVLYDAMVLLATEGCNASARKLQTALYELAKATAEYCEELTGKSSEKLENAVKKAKAALDAMYNDATQTTLDCVDLNKFVALGDANAYGPSADILADRINEFLGKQPVEYKNLTVPGQTAAQLRKELSKHAADLADATLITLSFNTSAFSDFAFDQAMNHALGKDVTCDWAAFVGEANAEYVQRALAKLEAELEERGYEKVSSIVVLVESYAFAYAQHVISYYPLVRDIHGMNPDAQVVMVGMHNPLEDVVAEVAGVNVPLGDFMRYLTDIANIYSLSYAMLSENKLFVDAFEIEVDVDADSFLDRAPTDAGYAEIADNIWNALNIQDHVWDEENPVIVEGGVEVHCKLCGHVKFIAESDGTGDMIGVVVALLAISGLGITVLKKKEF